MFTEHQIEELVDLLTRVDNNTRLYFGCDSVVWKRGDGQKMATYATVLVVHMNGKNGGRVFRHIVNEPVYDLKAGRPKMRLMKEVQLVSQLYVELAPLIDEFETEIHLDINPNKKYGSSCAAQEAAGYVLGMTGIEPKLKPEAFAASFGGDKYARTGQADVYH